MRRAIERWLQSQATWVSADDRPVLLRAAIGIVPWAVPLTIALAAATFVHQVSALQNEMALRGAKRTAFEDSAVCQRRGLTAGTHEHLLCMMDLNAKHAEQEADQSTTQTMLLP